MYVSSYVSTCVCIYPSSYVSLYLPVYLCIYLCVNVPMYLPVYVCMYLSIHPYSGNTEQCMSSAAVLEYNNGFINSVSNSSNAQVHFYFLFFFTPWSQPINHGLFNISSLTLLTIIASVGSASIWTCVLSCPSLISQTLSTGSLEHKVHPDMPWRRGGFFALCDF